MRDQLIALFEATAKRHKLNSVPELFNPETGLLKCAVQDVTEAPLDVVQEAVNRITNNSKKNVAPITQATRKEG